MKKSRIDWDFIWKEYMDWIEGDTIEFMGESRRFGWRAKKSKIQQLVEYELSKGGIKK